MDGKPPAPSWPLALIGVLLIVAAFALGVFGVLELRKWQTGGEWPSITAVVTNTSVYHYYDDKKQKTNYGINLIYTYTVNGQTYRYTEQETSYNYQEVAEKHRADFMGQKKTLWYNPDSPGQSTFFPMVAVLTAVAIVGAVVALMIGIFLFLRGAPAKSSQ